MPGPHLPTLCPQQPYHHVTLDLLVDTSQPVLPAVLCQAGLEPSLSPLFIVLFIQILVGQYQGPQPFPRVLLEAQSGETRPSQPQSSCTA